MKTGIRNFLVGAIIAMVMLSMSTFVVDQRQAAIVFQLGEVVRVETAPGLNFKLPLVQNVRFFDSRILTLDTVDPERFITAEKKNVLVDSYVKWRIVDVKQYYVSVGGDEARAQTRLLQTVNSSMREEFGKLTIHDVVSGKRDELMRVVQEKTDSDARRIGVEVLDVRLKRVDFPVEISDSVYRRMEAERKRVANELRATGNAESEKIRADADRQRQVTLSQAYREAQKIKGEGDARATALYAAAFGRNTEFFSFYRSMEAYKQTFKDKGDVMVLDPSSAFFKYLKSSGKSGQ
ncbi:MAG: protease modulator HflC [Gallionella sp.]|nr:protease modulator HflC [Gallionella sp.]OIO11072.1 MAG: HflC protein [Gallionellaceae bacterium CG1_02_60_325]PIR10012.1 MAG: HflC protein [Gallionellaceae bacterium CG11_big_fil_rev_8_21_14_0_20_60_62]PIY05246.1 MAG: protease modulator HflC [Gallionellaceae bacterium CG_4_10_14_3_um_filter_60_1069]PJC05398.1 MAG: protease modulator HflC [Gallionellaceae bacterium CG_4_9_14_0_8_um_filter_60_335]